MATAWSSSDRVPTHIVQVSDREIRNDDPGGWYGIRTNTSKRDGVYYFEVVFKENNGNGVIVGIANSSASVNDYPGANSSAAVGFWNNGGRFLGGSSSGSLGSPADGDTVRFLVDFRTQQIQAALNGGSFSAVCDFSSVVGPWFIIASFNTGPVAVVAAWAAADFKYAIPSGAVSWDDGVAGENPPTDPTPTDPGTGGDYTIPDGYRLYDPTVDLKDALAFLYDVLTPSSLVFNADKSKVTDVKSRVGSSALRYASSGIPRYQALNGNYAIFGAYDYAYYKSNGALNMPNGGLPMGLLYVGISSGAYNATLSLQDASGNNILGLGTVNYLKVGGPAPGSDIYTDVPYTANGNITYIELDGASPQNAKLYNAGLMIGSASRTNAIGKVPSRIQLLSNGDSKTEIDSFQIAAGFTRLLTASEKQDLFAWCAWRCNMTDQLPTNSPWLRGPPVVKDDSVVTPKRRRRSLLLLS